jgi:tRNA1(Val) A37 N6-methylase TrmN6
MIISDDTILGGRVRLKQAVGGYRAGLDAALLAAACDPVPAGRALDVGCGVGGVMLAAAARWPATTFLGLERDAAAVALAHENIALNGFEALVAVIEGDAVAAFSKLGLPPFDSVVSNPPYFDDATALRGPAPAKLNAWIAPEGLAAWLGFMTKAAREGGAITVIHRADRLADLLAGLALKAGSFQIRPVHPFADAPAKRVLVRAVKTGKAPLRLLPPLILHDRDGAKYRPDVEAILRGEAYLGWT